MPIPRVSPAKYGSDIDMPIIVRDQLSLQRQPDIIQVRDAANVPRQINQIWIRDSNNVPKLVYSLAPPMTAVASPSSVFGRTSGTGIANTGFTTVTPTGGTAPYTYAWTLVEYDGSAPPTATAANAATTRFTQTGIFSEENYTARWKCTVTDSSPSPYTASAFVNAFWSDINL